MSFETTALPSELLVSPHPLVGICGLDVNKIAVHKAIWDTFSNNRKAERPCVQFKLLPDNYEFPAAKQHKSYEWYHPKGILKRNWMLKHLHVLPAVVVLFQDLEWNDSQWTEKQLQCVKSLQLLKNALRERDTRICLVLIQETPPLPPGEDVLASERAASLIAASGINSKMLFILPQTEHLMGYVLRLESAFLDMAQSYYALMSKRIRTHSDQLTTAHTLLKVRHQFKLGFIAEIRQDFNTSLKHYTQSYTTLDEIRITEANCLEIKTVAGFLNYKICRLMFKLKVPRDSINHFISHVDKYRNRTGSKDLIFEHYAWLSTQHKVFAELFAEAIKNGLPALQTQHPGIYFHKAAEYLHKRREAFELMNADPASFKDVDNIYNNIQLTSLHTDYFGIRQVVSNEPLTEPQIIHVVRQNEKHYNHSMSIINMLSLAMAQLKIYKCLRFRKKLAIEMADEYFKSGDHAKALTLYSLMLTDYRSDNWHLLFSDVLFKTLKCALQTASVASYLSCTLEALSLKVKCATNERIAVLENMWKVLQIEPPVQKTQSNSNVYSSWEEALSKIKSPIQVDLDKLVDLFDIISTFEQYEIKNEDIMRFSVVLRLQTDVPIKIRNLHIIITDSCSNYKIASCHYSQHTDIHNLKDFSSTLSSNSPLFSNEQHLLLEPAFYHRFFFVTEAQQFMENIQLRVAGIEAQIGTDKLTMAVYKSIPHMNNEFRYHRLRDLGDHIKTTPSCYIKPTFHLVVNCNTSKNTMLVNEYYPITLTISNPHNVFMTGIGMHIEIPNSLKNKVFLAYDVAPNKQKLYSSIQIDVGDLAVNTFNTVHFFVFSLVEATINLQQKIFYATDVLKPKKSTAIVVSNVTAQNSTDVSPEYSASSEKALTAFNNDSDVLSHLIMRQTPPIQLEFLNQNILRKTQETSFTVNCEAEFKLKGRFYSLNRKPLTKIFYGEIFLFRASLEFHKDAQLEILETYFLCDQNLIQTYYNLKRKVCTNPRNFEDIMFLRTVDRSGDWTVNDNERNENSGVRQLKIFKYLKNYRKHLCHDNKITKSKFGNSNTMQPKQNTMDGSSHYNKNSSALLNEDNTENYLDTSKRDENGQVKTSKQMLNTRLVFNKALDAIHANGHWKGFIRESVLVGDIVNQQPQKNEKSLFGLYCVKWRRKDSKEENESKFVVQGIPLLEPPLNIFCCIEEKMFVKIPLNFKVTLKNTTAKVIHITATLNISMTDNFICSGHKQLDVSIFSFSEKELVYNLYPLQVGWQSLPELTLVYNVQDRTKDEQQDIFLSELVQRSVPKKVFVLPPPKQQLR